MQHITSTSITPLKASSSTAYLVSNLRRNFSLFVLILLAWCILGSSAWAQNIKHTQNNLDSAKRSDFTVDPTTLGLGFEITIGNYPGRAGTSLPVRLSYSSKLWRMNAKDTYEKPYSAVPKTRTEAKYAEYSASGWTTNLDLPRLEGLEWMPYDYTGAGICILPSCVQENSESATFYVYRMMVHMPDGSAHELRRDDMAVSTHTSGGVYYAVDGSRVRYDANTDVLYLADGARYLNIGHGAGAIQYIDRNGNTLSYNLSTSQWTDTLGRVISRPPLDSTQTGVFNYIVKGVGGADLTYKLHWSRLTDVRTDATQSLRYSGDRTMGLPLQPKLSPALFDSTAEEIAVTASNQVFNPIVLHKIELPDGRTYTFTYNVWGEIDKVVYPTGAYERYRYDMIEGISASLYENDVYRHANRGVVKRWVSETGDGTDEAQHYWQYSAGTNNETTPYTVVITAPGGSRTERLLKGPQSETIFGFEHVLSGKAYEERTYSSTGQMLRRTLTEWINTGALSGGQPSATRDARVTKQVEILLDTTGQALSATTTFDHDADMNVIATKRYGYVSVDQSSAQTEAIGFFSLGTLLRSEETTFLVHDPAIDTNTKEAYRARNLLSLPTSTRIKDGAGNIVAQSAISYDEAAYSPLTYPSVTSWTDPQTSVRGLVTTTSSWLNTTNTWLSSHAQYDQCGNLRKTWDAKGNLSQVEYSATYQYAYPTHTISPDPDGTGSLTSQTTDSVYDPATGTLTSQTDANDQLTTMEYGATDALGNPNPFRRLTKTNLPDGGWTAYAYNDEPGNLFVLTRTALDATRYTEARQYTDKMGREVWSEMSEGGSSIVTQKQYDQFGRLWRVSNPYRTGETVVWTTTAYDDLGRVLTVTTPDGTEVNTAYAGNQVTVTDQAGKKRSSTMDALGKLTEVIEDPGIGKLGYATNYSYDVLGNLTTVTQGQQTRTFIYDSLSRLTAAINPESGMGSYHYDSNGNLDWKTDARGVKTSYEYDALNRVKTRSYSLTGPMPPNYVASPPVNYFYDGTGMPTNVPTPAFSKGKLTAIKTIISETIYTEFDTSGNVVKHRQVSEPNTSNEQTYLMEYSYDLAGNLTSQKYPSGRIVETKYDDAGRIAGVKKQGSEDYYAGASPDNANRIQYSAHGAVTAMRLGNTLWEHTSFNTRLQPTEIGLGTQQGGVDRLKLNYSYGTSNNNGNVQSQTITVPGLTTPIVQTYSYDALNRIQNMSETGGLSQSFDYDRYGNRIITGGFVQDQSHVPHHLTQNDPALADWYDQNTNQLKTERYDTAGNVIKDTLDPNSGNTFDYDAENKQVSYNGGAGTTTGASYFYDGDGRRVKKADHFSTTVFVYNATGQMVAEYTNTTPQLGSGGTSYLTADNLGTPRIVTDASGAVKARHDYLPFGEEIAYNVGGRNDSQKYVYGSGNPDNVRQKFTKKERDAETGLDYFEARYYSSSQGRFTSPDEFKGGPEELFKEVDPHDPLFYAEIAAPQSLNKYQYCLNNPLRFIDPDGHQEETADIIRVVTAAASIPARVLNNKGADVLIGIGKSAANTAIGINNFTVDHIGGEYKQPLQPDNFTQDVTMTIADDITIVGALLGGKSQVGVMTAEAKETSVVAAEVGNITPAKNAAEMGSELSNQIGKNSVSYTTPNKVGHIDLQGKPHFDKATGTRIATPHVQERAIHISPNGRTNVGRQTTRPATKQDVRTARKLVQKRKINERD